MVDTKRALAARESAGSSFAQSQQDILLRVVRAYWEQRPLELCASVRCPVLVIAAEREGGEGTQEWMALKREGIEQIQSRLAECDVQWFPNSIHDLPLQRPKELAQAIEAFALSRED